VQEYLNEFKRVANKEGILYRIAEASVKRPDETVRDVVVEQDDDGTIRLNRLNYEMCMFQALREKMRVREIWVEGANRYRNHDNDLPIDFSQKRDIYYEALHERGYPEKLHGYPRAEQGRFCVLPLAWLPFAAEAQRYCLPEAGI
jgi:hypothetical protein